MGHPSRSTKFIGIGNEQWGQVSRSSGEFIEAIRAQYPEMKIIGSSGPQAEGKILEYLWPEMKRVESGPGG